MEALKQGAAQEYINRPNVLKEIKFDEIWKRELLPELDKQITHKATCLEQFQIDKLLNNIKRMKGVETIDEIKIFMVYLSNNIAFSLYQNCFLDMFNDFINIPQLMAHELMHGFASNQLCELYTNYVQSNAYLKEKYRILIEEIGSGPEEDFVAAIEHYLVYLIGMESREKLLVELKKRYNGCLPVSVMIFDMLVKEETVPQNYNEWLIDKFNAKVFPVKDIEDYINDL